MQRESIAYARPGRGRVIEGQVWSPTDTAGPDVEVLKVFNMGSHAGHEYVLVLPLSNDEPVRREIRELADHVVSIQRSVLERDYEMILGPDTSTLAKALTFYVEHGEGS